MAQQTIVPTSSSSTFPGCALSCSVLLQAESVCLPPNQPASSQFVYDQCFCNSAFLAQLRVTTDAICITECSILSDRQLLQSWYNSFCAQVAQGVDPTTQTTTPQVATTIATGTATITSGTVIATSTPTSTSGSSSSSSSAPAPHKTWIDTHWGWVLGIIIIAIGLGFLAWLAVYLKKRHRRKLAKQRAEASGFGYDPEKRPPNDPQRSATPDLWGPHQMMQATQGYSYGYQTDGVAREPGNKRTMSYRGAESSNRPENDVIERAEPKKAVLSPRPSNRRARPSELEINARMIGAADRRSKSRGKSRTESHASADKEVEAGLPQRRKSRSRSKKAADDTEKT